jgi:hypothetical protein
LQDDYVSLPEGETLRMLQVTKQLPDSLPIAKLSIFQRLKGHLGFILVAAFLIGGFLHARKKDREEGIEA